jgi:hypothetical protein
VGWWPGAFFFTSAEKAPVISPIEGKALRRIAMMNVVDLFPDLKGGIDVRSYQEIEILEAKPQKRTIRVKADAWNTTVNHYYVGLPYLQFVRYLEGFFVSASKRPLTVKDIAWEETNLLLPPLPNIYSDGHVCLAKGPVDVKSTEEAIELFWHAIFTPEEMDWGGYRKMHTLYGSFGAWEKKTRESGLKHILDNFESRPLLLRHFCINEAAREARRRKLAEEVAREVRKAEAKKAQGRREI